MLNVIWGSHKEKPESANALVEALTADPASDGYLYIGYPIVGSPLGPLKFDALLVSRAHGLVAFDLVEGMELGEFRDRLDEIASMLEVKLKPYPALKSGRKLKFEIAAISFAPAKYQLPIFDPPYFCANRKNLREALAGAGSPIDDVGLFAHLLAAIQVVTSIRSGKLKREPKQPDSRGARLKRVEDSIANLDQHQSRAVIETVDGLQRIRGLAGSGKTIILALKVAYLHSQNPDWNIAVTFNTRSLKEQFRRLINGFTIEQTGSEPDWDKIRIINAWGAPGEKERDGMYHQYCRENSVPFMDFGAAKTRFGAGDGAFAGACAMAIAATPEPKEVYDAILIDEAQDFPPQFIRLCHRFLKAPKRLVYAYDELQTLTSGSVLPPEDLFGKDKNGNLIVPFDSSEMAVPRQDIILEKCYRNSRPVLATAHALGFGVYRDGGLVQFFDQDSLWTDVGYAVVAGELKAKHDVSLARTPDSSPPFLEDHSPPDDLIQFITFESEQAQTEWLVANILRNIREEELRPEDVVVINPDPLKTQEAVGVARSILYSMGVNNELAGVSTSQDVFSKENSVTFTGVFRAKGNEAGMVYVLNAQDCFGGFTRSQVAVNRNRLFTAITRSKAWVRVLGVGPNMDKLRVEWERLRTNGYALTFNYPSEEEKKKLKLINVDPTPRQAARERRLLKQRDDLLKAARRGELDLEQLINDLKRVRDSQ